MATRAVFEKTRGKRADARLARILKGAFREQEKVRSGTYIGNGQVEVYGQRYRFQNTGGVSLAVGEKIRVKRLGRPAAAYYAPAEDAGAGVVYSGGTGGGGGSTGTHTHTDLSQQISGHGLRLTTNEGNISTLQSDMSTAQTDIDAAESNIATAQSDIAALQSAIDDRTVMGWMGL